MKRTIEMGIVMNRYMRLGFFALALALMLSPKILWSESILDQKFSKTSLLDPFEFSNKVLPLKVNDVPYYAYGRGSRIRYTESDSENVLEATSDVGGSALVWIGFPTVKLGVLEKITLVIELRSDSGNSEFRLGLYHLGDLKVGPSNGDHGIWTALGFGLVQNQIYVNQVMDSRGFSGFLSGDTTRAKQVSPPPKKGKPLGRDWQEIVLTVTRKMDEGDVKGENKAYRVDVSQSGATQSFHLDPSSFSEEFNVLAFNFHGPPPIGKDKEDVVLNLKRIAVLKEMGD
ncbi:MAG: hypothetical protein V4507_06250 [Verrucomicrobiota bacterium]